MQPRFLPYCLLLPAVIAPLAAHAQGSLKHFNGCATQHNYRLALGDTIVIQCDSSVLMNSQNFHIYETAYRQYRLRNPNADEIISSYEALVTRQDSMIASGQQDYNALKLKFDTLYYTSLAQLDQTSRDVGTVKEHITLMSSSLSRTQILIGDAMDKVNQERKKSFLNRLYWGLGGLGIGVGLTALLAGIN